MTYSITNTAGSQTYTVLDGYFNSIDTELTFIGKGFTGYGTALNTNLLHILENFAGNGAPTKPVTGQLWYDLINSELKVYDGSSFVSVVTNGTVASLAVADLLFSTNEITNTNTNGNVNITPNGTGSTVVTNLGINGADIGKILYTTASGTVASATASYTPVGDTLTVTNINSTNVAATTGSFTSISITGNVDSGNLKTAGSVYSDSYYYSNGQAFASSVYSNANVTAYLTDGTVTISNLTVTGTASLTATQAKYADLAENYVSDFAYDAGTVVQFGGIYEITIADKNTKRVAGVVSTNPAYLMNSEAAGEFILPIALQGRVPCKVYGPVAKGDILVSAGNGFAEVDNNPTVGTIIGKSLMQFDQTEGIIEVVVGRY